MTALQQHHHFLEQSPDERSLVAGQDDLVAPHHDVGAGELALDLVEPLVLMPEQTDHQVISRDGDSDRCGVHWDLRRVTGTGDPSERERFNPRWSARRR